jgi:hypothetical protein
LQACGVDIPACIEQARYIALDAADTLSTFKVNGMLESVRFLETFGKLILNAANAAKGEHPRVALFGEGADLMWRQDDAAGRDSGRKTLQPTLRKIRCGYSMRVFTG